MTRFSTRIHGAFEHALRASSLTARMPLHDLLSVAARVGGPELDACLTSPEAHSPAVAPARSGRLSDAA